MKILAIDTATENCSVALLYDDRRINSPTLEMDRGHAERILTMVDDVLAEAQLSLSDLDALAFGRGPGGFTGVRLAASVIQGLAFGASKPVVPVSDLRAVAQQVFDAHEAARTVVVCNDARMQEVYWAIYVRGPSGLADLNGAEHVGKPAAVAIPPNVALPIHGAGRGFRAYPELNERLRGMLAAVHETVLPRAQEIVRLAEADFAAGLAVPAERALPVYLRDDVARPAASRI
jgi:tRNA threonylcarbamoyladenosine biosynthesis protein TsaB